jgi:hypothetical protein
VTIKRTLAVTVLALAASTAFAVEPTSLSQVKTIIMRFDSSASVTGLMLMELESRLPDIGIAVTEDESLADAELVVVVAESERWSFNAYGGGSRHQLTSGVRVRSLPSKRALFSVTSEAANDELDDACAIAVKKIVKKIGSARKE